MAIKKTCSGYRYTEEEHNFLVETDYYNQKIYLSVPEEDDDFETIERFAVAIRMAVKDFKQALKGRTKGDKK